MAASSLSSQDDSIIWFHATNEKCASKPALEALCDNLTGRPVFATPSSTQKDKQSLIEGEVYGANQIRGYTTPNTQAIQFLGFANGTTRLNDRTEYPRSTVAVIARGALPIYNFYITPKGKDLLPGDWLYVLFVDGKQKDSKGKTSDKKEWYALGDITYMDELLKEDGFVGAVTVHLQPVARVLSRTRGITLKHFKQQSQRETPASGKNFNTVYALITV